MRSMKRPGLHWMWKVRVAMAECMKDGVDCPDFYKCTEEGDIVQNLGKKLQRFCFYCLATPRIKKIGTVASWTGTTPPWCPKGRG